jgi:hypothetical protein
MLKSRRFSVAFCVTCITLAVLVPTALAAGPATVTVRVEGLNETKLPPTQVTTTTAPVVKDGKSADACPGISAAGALELATGGNWGGKWFGGAINTEGKFVGLGYAVETIAGENHAFGSGAFWDLWINHMASEHGACEVEPQAGAEVLFVPCSETASECPGPLGVQAAATANVGEAVAVTVQKYSSGGAASPAVGASVNGGVKAETTDANGHATLTFSSPGEFTVRATAPTFVRSETTICVHAGNDGTCGTQRIPSPIVGGSAGGGGGGSGVAGVSSPVPHALAAHVSGVIEGHVYGPQGVPRILSGSVLARAAVSSVNLELRRRYKGRCSSYNGVKRRFLPARCGHGSFFKVSSNGVFSYLLPARLGPGRYVLDLQASDAAGNHTTPARGSTRFVFYVR